MPEADTLDVARLGPYLEAHVSGFRDLQSVDKFAGGQSNPTYLLSAASGQYVLRRKPPGVLLKSAHAVDREYRVMRALADTAVPVPEALHLCEDDAVIGSMFFVMTFVKGRTFWNPALPELDADARSACYAQMNQTLAAIHSVDLDAVGLSDYGKPGNYFERQVTRWTGQYRAAETDAVPEMETVIAWLDANMVSEDRRVALVHGDFRIDNLLFAPDRADVVAVIDWELSTLGHPFADLAYQCALWRMSPDAILPGFKGVNRAALGLPEDAAYVDAYCARMGLSGIENWDFYVIFSLFRMAAIVQGVKKRALDGNASSDRAMEYGALVEPLAREAARIVDR